MIEISSKEYDNAMRSIETGINAIMDMIKKNAERSAEMAVEFAHADGESGDAAWREKRDNTQYDAKKIANCVQEMFDHIQDIYADHSEDVFGDQFYSMMDSIVYDIKQGLGRL